MCLLRPVVDEVCVNVPLRLRISFSNLVVASAMFFIFHCCRFRFCGISVLPCYHFPCSSTSLRDASWKRTRPDALERTRKRIKRPLLWRHAFHWVTASAHPVKFAPKAQTNPKEQEPDPWQNANQDAEQPHFDVSCQPLKPKYKKRHTTKIKLFNQVGCSILNNMLKCKFQVFSYASDRLEHFQDFVFW